ncbi:MAG: hypothetical protein WA608_22330, partial [Candidatus Acidiferrales bacterium]
MVFAMVAWLPLLMFSALEGVLVSKVKIPFLYDPAAYVRFLLAVPLLIVAETVIGSRIAEAASQFMSSGLIRERDYAGFDAAMANSVRLRNSNLAEVIILGITYLGAFEALQLFSTNVSTWNSRGAESVHRFTLPGYWYVLISIPIFQFLVLRWLWRAYIWYRFLWRVSKLDLQLVPTHPDQAGGLGFLGETQRQFAIVIFSYAATGSAVFSREILFEKIPIDTFKVPIAAFVVVVLALFLGPLFMFAPALLRTRRTALREYGTLGCNLGRLYHRKWMTGSNLAAESLLTVPDNNSLANYSRDYELVDRMRAFPFEPRTAIVLVLASLIPMAPLVATVMPVGEIFKLLL